MITANIASNRSSLSRNALIALGCALSLVIIPVSALNAAPTADLQPMTDAKADLPLTHSFAKVAGENGPFVLKLTNTSKASVKVTVQILLSVYSHATSKAKNLPEQTIDAGKDCTIPQLVALDKVIIKADGYSPLELTVQ
jgi:hypothetical protein